MKPVIRVPLMAAVVCGIFGVLEQRLGRDALLLLGPLFVTLLPVVAFCRLASAWRHPSVGEVRSDALVSGAGYAFLLWLGWSAQDGPHPATVTYAFVGTVLWVIAAMAPARSVADGMQERG